MFGKINELMEMKKQAGEIKKQLESLTVEVSEVRGIQMTITGAQNFRKIEIDESLLTGDNKQRLEADLLRSMNAAIKKSQNAAAVKMASVMKL
jgi:DNA-binding protein YbaB